MTVIQEQGLIEIIQETTGLTEEQIKKALDVQKETREPLPQTLVNMGLINDKDKAKILGRQWNIPFVDLSDNLPEVEAVKALPQHLSQRLKAVPVGKTGNRLTVAMVNPLDVYAIDQMRLVSGSEIEVVIATEDDINAAISHAFSGHEEIGAALQQVASEFGADGDLTIETAKSPEEELSIDQLKELVDDAPIVRLVNLIFRQALRDKASDIHIQPEYCLLYTSPSPRDRTRSRMPSSA